MKYTIVGARGTVGSVDAFMVRLREEASGLNLEVQAFDARMIFGEDHLRTAVEHAERAFARGTNVAKDRMMEILLYASGERQISTALEKVGLKEDGEGVALVIAGEGDVNALLRSLGLDRDDRLLNGKEELLPAFGISEAEIGTVPRDRVFDLVLERVALVDLMK